MNGLCIALAAPVAALMMIDPKQTIPAIAIGIILYGLCMYVATKTQT